MKTIVSRTFLAGAGALLLALPPIGFAAAAEAGAAEAAAQGRETAGAAVRFRARLDAAEAEAKARRTEALAAEAESLRPGGFVWQPDIAGAGAVEIVVSIPLQRAFVYRGGTLIGISTVSTGRPGHETPIGRFAILQKRPRHFSNLYNNAPMPFMQRLTWDGIALHAGEIPGRPASHGCVRLPLAFARLLFAVTQVGAAVHVVDSSPSPGEALAMVRGGLHRGMGGPIEEAAAE
ncbi:MAG TPA: L,D-transpeptidase family protein [Allosphingosinicella sp.]|jgi:lipoprotein-anchoring transpeptidase ErfK/SrfK